jgi:hypothetical protein
VKALLGLLGVLPLSLVGAGTTAMDLAGKIRQAGLNPEECYRVRDLAFSREELRFYLTDGYLIFGRPVDGRIVSAVFSAHNEGGDAELLLMPPLKSERLSLATFTQSPNLNEHFRIAVMLFTDATGEELGRLVGQRGLTRSPETGLLLERQFASSVNNLAASFGMRFLYDLLSGAPPEEGFFYAALRGNRLGNFDVVYDPTAAEQIQVGQVNFRDNRAFFDVWTSFAARSFRTGARRYDQLPVSLTGYRIEATLKPDLELEAVTVARLRAGNRRHPVLHFEISESMDVTSVAIDGQACEVFQREALRDNLLRGRGNKLFLVIPPRPLEPGQSYELEFRHRGRVVSEAGNGVYYVGSRGSWYPRQGVPFADYDVTFRYPATLDLVLPGEAVDERTEGEWRIVRRRTESPVRLFGFNVGEYRRHEEVRGDYRIQLFANRRLEKALEPPPTVVLVPRNEPPWGQRRQRGVQDLLTLPAVPPRANPAARLEALAKEIADAFEFMAEHFGPPPSRTLTVSPIPGFFGQGFSGLLYLSTVSYLDPAERPQALRNEYHRYFFSEILHAHETAHQWWGNVVTARSYQDEWVMEALANYSALMMLEKRKGAAALRQMLERYRENLLARNESGETVESAGPISWGPRLDSSQARAWRTITYEKGSWIIHMLRRRLGDERFLAMLGELCRRYRFQSISTEEFRKLAAEFLPPGAPDPELETFFDTWVYGVGIPELDFSHSLRGQSPKLRFTATLRQRGVPADFSILAPVELRFAGKPSQVHWLRTDGEEPATLQLTLAQRPSEVVFNPGDSVLAVVR